MAMPREGHLEQIFHILAYLRIQHNSSMVFDPTDPDIDDSQFVRDNWLDSAYSKFKEELPTNAPQPKGIDFTVRAFIYSDHAGELTLATITNRIHYLSRLRSHLFVLEAPNISGNEFIWIRFYCD